MAVELPPWLNPPNYVGAYTGGMGIGTQAGSVRARDLESRRQIAAQMAMQRDQLAQRQAEAELEAQTRREVAAQNALAEQHRIDIESQYRNINLGLEAQKLEQQQRMDEAKLKEATMRAAAEMRIQSRVKAGEPWEKVVMEEGVGAGWTPSQMALPTTGKPTWVPPDVATGAPGHFLQSGGRAYVPPAASATVKDPFRDTQSDILKSTITQMEKDRLLTKEGSNERQSVENQIRMKSNELRQLYGQPPLPGHPLPATQKELVIGRVYETKRGPAVWDGEQFVPE